MLPTEAEQRDNRKTTRRTYCSRRCAGLARRKRTAVECMTCGKPFEVKDSRTQNQERFFCSNECYQKDHATNLQPRACRNCGDRFFPESYTDAVYCSRNCMAEDYRKRNAGARNPNHGGVYYSGGWEMPAEVRLELSHSRMGEDNPRYINGAQAGAERRFQLYVAQWARTHFPSECHECGGEAKEVHHIVPRRRFENPVAAHFRRNLLLLCVSCHRSAEGRIEAALEEESDQPYPFGDHLPESILRQLKQDGSVSTLPRTLDYAPLGNVASRVVQPEWFDDKAA